MSSVVAIYFYAISRSGKKQSSAMVFTIYQSEYVSRANINHWMLAVSQINEIIAHNLQGEADVNARTLQNRDRHHTTSSFEREAKFPQTEK